MWLQKRVQNVVKRNVKRGETKPSSSEMNSSILEGLRFMYIQAVSIGKPVLKPLFVSRFTGIGVKRETGVCSVKRA
jgi:hypothetical protein